MQLPPVSLGLWHNFSEGHPFETGRAIVRRAFDLGITHFDLTNDLTNRATLTLPGQYAIVPVAFGGHIARRLALLSAGCSICKTGRVLILRVARLAWRGLW